MVVYGATDPKGGAVHTLYQLLSDPRLNHRPQTVGGVLLDRCGEILTRFFQEPAATGQEVTVIQQRPAAGRES